MASLLTLPRELRDEIVDLLLLTHNPQPADVSESDVYDIYHRSSPTVFPRPVKHHAAGLCQASRQLRTEVLQRSSSLQLGLRYALRIIIHRPETRERGLFLEPRLRWIDTPVADANNLDKFDISFELNDLYGRAGRNATINKGNIEVTVKESQAFVSRGGGLKGDNALEKLERILSDGGQQFANFCIAMAIKYSCLGVIDLVRNTDTEPVTLLPSTRNKFWQRIGSISLQAGTTVRRKTWYIDRKLIDRMVDVEDPKYHKFIADILLQRGRNGLDQDSMLANDHYEDPETVVLSGSRDRNNHRHAIGVRIHKTKQGWSDAKPFSIEAWKEAVRGECFREEWKA
ncbi:hypothetical protein J4E85_007169 [Alternaria conjuncta]|uniref:uncharacterized protein n=1 Tax=Alternaria conjuncta TaxID=181017 RepID=UPI00222039D1|nr:uncharacterized protein J4E85_007169 [Alternaria conjuncta]KAI4925291.1 hypothetical protein J4E85_007169 [Alternaria conjuncta]